MKTRRRFLAVMGGVASMGALALAACGGQSAASGGNVGAAQAAKPAMLRWSADFEATFQPYVDAALAKFKQQAPQITVQTEFTTGEDYYTKLRTLLAAVTMPDVSLMTTRWSAQWLRGTPGAYRNQDDTIKREKYDTSDFWPLLLPGFSDARNHLHILPYDISVILLYSNKALLQADGAGVPDASWTLDKLLEVARRLTKDTAGGKQYGYAGMPTGGQFEFAIERFGGSLFDDKATRCTMNSAGSVAGVQWWADLRHRHGVAPSAAAEKDLGGAEKAFGTGAVAMAALGTTSVARVRGYSIDWDVAPIPKGPRGDQLRSGGGGYGIAGATASPDQSWLLLKHLTSKDTLAEMFGRSGRSIPGRRSVADTSADATKPPKSWPVAFKEAERAKAISFSLTAKGGDVLGEVNSTLNAIFNNGGDVKNQLEALTTKVDALLAAK